MAKVLTLELVKRHLRLTDAQTHLDEEIEDIRIPAAESAAEHYLDAPFEDYADQAEAPYPVPARMVTALLYLVEADMERDPKTLELYVTRAHALLFNDRKRVGV